MRQLFPTQAGPYKGIIKNLYNQKRKSLIKLESSDNIMRINRIEFYDLIDSLNENTCKHFYNNAHSLSLLVAYCLFYYT